MYIIGETHFVICYILLMYIVSHTFAAPLERNNTTEQNISMCANSPCQNRGFCIDDYMGMEYACFCRHGFTGLHCETVVELSCADECVHGVCTEKNNTITCTCNPGYTGRSCESDMCANSPCQNRGTCRTSVYQPAVYSCFCRRGFTGRHCETAIGCVDVCVYGVCTKNNDTYTCTCNPGFTGRSCRSEIDMCANSPCQNGGYCHNDLVDYTCDCDPGFTGINCETETGCPDGCVHGVCTENNKTNSCTCYPGFTGRICESVVDMCASSPCQNHGVCKNYVVTYTCSCLPGFTGLQCETDIYECESSPCQNGGTCIDKADSYSCKCFQGYLGPNCEARGKIVSSRKHLWPDGEVYYRLVGYKLKYKEIIIAGIREFELSTCLKFVNYDKIRSSHGHHLFIMSDGRYEYASYIGLRPKMKAQKVWLKQGDSLDNLKVLHELGHAIGLHHEHQRPDRDKYISVDHNGYNTKKLEDLGDESNTFDLDYDYFSVMHYDDGFIQTKDPAMQSVIGMSKHLSPDDIKIVELMYECKRPYNKSGLVHALKKKKPVEDMDSYNYYSWSLRKRNRIWTSLTTGDQIIH